MEKTWRCLKDPTWILFVFVVLFLCTAGSHHPHTAADCDDHPPLDTAVLQKIGATPAALTPKVIHKKITCPTKTIATSSTAMINANVTYNTENASDATNSPFYTSPNSTESSVPSKPSCLQGWAIFLICFAAILTVFLLAGIPVMLFYFFQCRRLRSQQPCARYKRKLYVAPEEQTLPLE